MGRNVLLGFAGPGKVTKNTVKDLLKDHLSLGPEGKNGLPEFPDDVDEIRVVIPAKDDWITDTVKLLWQWADGYADLRYEVVYDGDETRKNREILEFADKVIEGKNVAFELVERLVGAKKDGDEVTLIVAWGDKGDENTEMLVDLAQAKQIKVMDLTAGLDDQPLLDELHFNDEVEREPEPRRRRRTEPAEPEEAAAEPRPRRGRPRMAAETSPEPAQATQADSVEDQVSLARRKAQKVAESGAPKGDVIMRALYDSRVLVRSLDTAHMAMTGREEPVPSELYRKLEEAIEKYSVLRKQLSTDSEPDVQDEPAEVEPEEKPRRTAGRRRSDGSPAQPRSARARGVKEWFDPDQGEHGEWVRAGRGRLPRDVKVRTVDPKTGDVIPED